MLFRSGGAAGLSALRAASSLGSGAATAYQLGQATSGASGLAGIGAGIAGVARAGAGMVGQGARGTAERLSGTMAEAAATGRQGAWRATGGALPSASAGPANAATTSVPAWARRLQSEQRLRAHTHVAAQAVKEGDRPGHGANPDLHQRDE